MNRLVVLCAVFVAGLGIGGAASWLMLDQGDRPAAGPPITTAGDRTEAGHVPAYVAPPSAGESRATSPGIRGKAFKDVANGTVEDATGVPLTGTMKLSGKVKSDKGEPLAGVVVRADYRGDRNNRANQGWKKGDGPPPEEDMQARVQRFIADAEQARAMRREATTGENGEYTIDGLLDDRYGLRAYLKGWVITPDQRDNEWSARPGMPADFTASGVIVLPVDVRLADGNAPKKAQLNITVHNSTSGEQWSPDRAELRLGAGSYAIHATSGDHQEWRSEAQNVALKEGEVPKPLAFRLVARTGIHGRVKVPKGYALDSMAIFALRYAGSAVPDENALRRGQNDWASPWNSFEFDFHDLAPGTWLVGAGTWESVFATKTVEVAAGTIAEVVIEITDAGAGGLVVKVMGPDNAPVADANVRVSSSQHDASEAFSMRPQKDGAWVVAAKKEGSQEGRDWMIHVHSERYGDKNVPLPSSTSGELRIDMAEPATLEVTIAGYVGSGLEGRLHVSVRPLAGKDVQRISYGRDDQIGPDGRMTVKSLQPGRYRVELGYQRERWSSSALEKMDIDVAPGANAVSVPIPAVYTLTVIVGGEGDANVGLQQIATGGEEPRWHNAKVGADGTATFEGLAAGTYRVNLWTQKGRRNKAMKVTVPAAGPVTFKEEAETALIVRVLDTEGYLASVGFAVGDVITGAEGAAFEGSRPAMQVLGGLMMARKDLKLSVLRAAKTIEITVDTEKFGTATNHLQRLEGTMR